MAKKIKIQSICADYSESNAHVFDVNGDYRDYDCHNTCVIWNYISFYGIPFDLLDDRMADIYAGDYKETVKVGELLGCLILCRQMLDEGADPLEICQDIDADLEYTISVLSGEEEGPLSTETGDPCLNVYYIHELKMEEGYEDAALQARLLKELPGLILTFAHVAPDILAIRPAPTGDFEDPEKAARHQALQSAATQKLSIAYHPIFGQQVQGLSKEAAPQTEPVIGKRHAAFSYPEEAKNGEEFSFYQRNGFKEAGDSRLLYKYVGRG